MLPSTPCRSGVGEAWLPALPNTFSGQRRCREEIPPRDYRRGINEIGLEKSPLSGR